MNDHLIVHNTHEHNLKNINLNLPHDAMIVFTNLSKSNKSNLTFDTIFTKKQHHYVESLSTYTQQFLNQMDKPNVDFIKNLSPTVSIDQKSTSKNPQSTINTITKIYNYLHLLYTHINKPHYPMYKKPIAKQTPQQIVNQILKIPKNTRFQILTPIIREHKNKYINLFADLQTKNFARIQINNIIHSLTNPPKLKKQKKHTIKTIVDHLSTKPSSKQQITNSIKTTLGLANSLIILNFVNLTKANPHREQRYSEHLTYPNDHPLAIDDLEPQSFSFNSPFGTYPIYTNLNTHKKIDPKLVVPNPKLNLTNGTITP